MIFTDYNRTVIGYHGTRLSVAREIVARQRAFDASRNPDDWLGHGVYFWEHAPRQAAWWAARRQRRHNWGEPIAVLGSMIRLGNCLDLLDPRNTDHLERIYQRFLADLTAVDETVPRNFNTRKFLDCAVFQYAYQLLQSETNQAVDSSRAVYVPTGKDKEGRDKRLWPRSWIVREAHIQLCVRNPACIMGTWLEELPDDRPAGGGTGEKVSDEPDEQNPPGGSPQDGPDVCGAPS